MTVTRVPRDRQVKSKACQAIYKFNRPVTTAKSPCEKLAKQSAVRGRRAATNTTPAKLERPPKSTNPLSGRPFFSAERQVNHSDCARTSPSRPADYLPSPESPHPTKQILPTITTNHPPDHSIPTPHHPSHVAQDRSSLLSPATTHEIAPCPQTTTPSLTTLVKHAHKQQQLHVTTKVRQRTPECQS